MCMQSWILIHTYVSEVNSNGWTKHVQKGDNERTSCNQEWSSSYERYMRKFTADIGTSMMKRWGKYKGPKSVGNPDAPNQHRTGSHVGRDKSDQCSELHKVARTEVRTSSQTTASSPSSIVQLIATLLIVSPKSTECNLNLRHMLYIPPAPSPF